MNDGPSWGYSSCVVAPYHIPYFVPILPIRMLIESRCQLSTRPELVLPTIKREELAETADQQVRDHHVLKLVLVVSIGVYFTCLHLGLLAIASKRFRQIYRPRQTALRTVSHI